MPATINPNPQKIGRNTDPIATSSGNILRRAAHSHSNKPTLHYSFAELDNQTASIPALPIIPYENGLVRGIIRAYQQELHLVLRPDDIWLAILTQFSFYVTGHAEQLRHHFVAHSGQKELVLQVKETFATLNVSHMARKFTCLMQEHLCDGEVRDWIIPAFTTTTDDDMAVASLALMATMKHYFTYTAMSLCGFPSVTLLGEREDWVEIRRRVERLALYGDELETWSKLLGAVVDRFVATFDYAGGNTSNEDHLMAFWDQVCYSEGSSMSGGVDTFSGWITAFSYWKTDGKRNLEAEWGKTIYKLDGHKFPVIDQADVISGVMEVPLKFLAYELGIEFDTTLVVGSVGVTVNEDTEKGTVVQPRSGWWMLENSKKQISG